MRRKPASANRPTKGLPCVGALVGEAWRNVMSGATRALLFAGVFAVVVGGLGVAQARTVVGFVAEALAFETSGGAVQIVTMPEGIDGAQCDGLASLPGIVASGALRNGPGIVLAQLPSTSISSLEGTVGFGLLLNFGEAGGLRSQGGWVASDLANAVGLTRSDGVLALADGSSLLVGGIYQYPNDGRSQKLAFQIVSPTAPVGPFDECWLLAWPDPDLAAPVLTLPAILGPPAPDQMRPAFSQLNTTLGISFDGPTQFAKLPLKTMGWAGIGIGFLVGFASIRLRRLELASALHAGVAKTALALQVALETAWWLALALALSCAATIYSARTGNVAEWEPAWLPAAQTLTAASCAVVLGALVATTITRETHLFRYFKNR